MQQQLPPLTNFDNYTFRASSVGKIMGKLGKSPNEEWQICSDEIVSAEALNAKANDVTTATYINRCKKIEQLKLDLIELSKYKDDKNPKLPATCISYLMECYVQKHHNVKKDIFSKYFEKGKSTEQFSIDMLSELHGIPYDKCLLPRQRNEFIEGECDVKYFDDVVKKIIDMKNSWDYFTFYKRFLEEIDPTYKWQGVSYLELYGGDEFNLIFALTNMPQSLIDDEFKRILYKFGSAMEGSAEYLNACVEFEKTVTFDHMPLRERFYELPTIKRNKDEYDQICARIPLCRDWLNNFAKSEYLRVWGVLPEGVSMPVAVIEEEIKFVELIEITAPTPNYPSGTNEKPIVEVVEFKGIEETITIIEEVLEVNANEMFPNNLDDIKPETISEPEPEDIQAFEGGYPDDALPPTCGAQESELGQLMRKIDKCQTVDQVRDLRKELLGSGKLELYPSLKDSLIAKRDSFTIAPPPPPAPAQKPTPKPTPIETKPEPKTKPKPTATLAPTPELVESGLSPEDQLKYDEIRTKGLAATSTIQLREISKPNQDFLIKHKELMLELMKHGQTLDLKEKSGK